MRSFHLTVGAAGLAMLAALAAPAQAQMVTPFGKGQIALEPGDIEEIRGSVRSVLEEYRVGASASWSSATTNRAGHAYITETFERQGMRCAQVTHEFTAGGGNVYTLPMCQVADGSWKIAF